MAFSRSLLVCLSPALLCAFIYIFWFRDILYELTCIGDLPLPEPSPPANERERDSEAPMASLTPPKDDSPSPSDVSSDLSDLQRVTRHVPIPMGHIPLPQERRSAAQEDQFQMQDQLRLLPPPQLSQAHRPLHAQRSSDRLQPPQPSECYRLLMYNNEHVTLPPHGKFSMTGQSLLDYQSHSYWYPSTELARSGSTTTNVTSPIIGNSDTSSFSSTFSYRYPIVTETKSSTQRYGLIGGGAGSLMGTTGSGATYNPYHYYPGALDVDTGSYVAPTISNRSSYARSSSSSGESYAAPTISSTASHAASALSVNTMGMYSGQSLGGDGMVHAPQGSHLRLVDKYAEQQTPHIDPDLMSTRSTAPTGFVYVFVSSFQYSFLLLRCRLEEWGSYLSNIGEPTWDRLSTDRPGPR